MLKVSQLAPRNGHDGHLLKVEGRATGASVAELRRVCGEILAQIGTATHGLVLDLDGLSFLDGEAVVLFRELAARNVLFTNCSVFVAEQLKEVADGRP